MNRDGIAASLDGVSKALDVQIVDVKRLAGGDVSGALLIIDGAGQRFVVKRSDTARQGMFAAEANGLARLRRSGAIRVPETLAVMDMAGIAAGERFIALEYLETTPEDVRLGRTAEFGRQFGEALARLHQGNRSESGRYGLDAVSFLGRRPLDNSWSADWDRFYCDQRIGAVLPECAGALGADLLRRVQRLKERIPALLEGMPHSPCLIHGDLWSGNYLVCGNAPVLIDPAAFFGHPEHEWAYIELFGGFPPGMRDGYDCVAPLDAGYEHRRPLLQLFHILVHVAHFGEPYAPAVVGVCDAYGL